MRRTVPFVLVCALAFAGCSTDGADPSPSAATTTAGATTAPAVPTADARAVGDSVDGAVLADELLSAIDEAGTGTATLDDGTEKLVIGFTRAGGDTALRTADPDAPEQYLVLADGVVYIPEGEGRYRAVDTESEDDGQALTAGAIRVGLRLGDPVLVTTKLSGETPTVSAVAGDTVTYRFGTGEDETLLTVDGSLPVALTVGGTRLSYTEWGAAEQFEAPPADAVVG